MFRFTSSSDNSVTMSWCFQGPQRVTRLLPAASQAALRWRRALCATLHVDPANAAALALYARFGFTEDGLLTDYYAPGRPALKMILDLAG